MSNQYKTYGKIILIGEHSVVYGKPAIAIPFDGCSLEVKIDKNSENLFSCKFFDGKLEDMENELLGLKSLVEEFFLKFGIKEKVKITIDSTIPNERGMGSSAAASIALARALYGYFEIENSIDDVKELANISEKIVHGNPSGVDIGVVSSNQSLYFIKGQPFEVFDVDIDAFLVIADTGIKGSTKEAVQDVAKLVESDEIFKEKIEDLGKLTIESKEYIKENNVELLGDAMNKAHQNLKDLTVSNEALDELVALARKSGALGAKLTGGGRGGCMIALCKDELSASKVFDTLKKRSSGVWMTSLKKNKGKYGKV